VGEKVSVYDSATVKATVDRLEGIFFVKGYFLAKTSPALQVKSRKASVKYIVNPGPAYHYDSIEV